MKARRRTNLRTINSGFAIASYDLFLLGFWSLERSPMYIDIIEFVTASKAFDC